MSFLRADGIHVIRETVVLDLLPVLAVSSH